MEKTKNVLVCLDCTEVDNSIIQYAAFIVDHSYADKVTFINIIKNLDIPDDVLKEFPDIKKNALKERKEQLSVSIKTHFNPTKKISKSLKVIAGREAKAILEFCDKEDIDLIVIGRKNIDKEDSNVLATRLARRASCTLLIVPENSERKLNKILIPIDFSEYSKMAVQKAIEIASIYEEKVEITAQNVYSVPTGYHYSGKSYEEFAEVMKKNSEKDYAKFIRKINTKDIDITPIYNLDINDNLISDILDLAQVLQPNCIIVGAKGRTATAALFLGSFAEKLVNAKPNFPLLIVRPKGKNVGFIDYFKDLSK